MRDYCEWCENGRNLVEFYGDSAFGEDEIQFDVCIEDKKLVAAQYDPDTMCIDKDFFSINFCPVCGRDLTTNGKPRKPSFEGETVYYISDHENLENDCFYSDLEAAKEAAVYSSEYNYMTHYVYELAIERKFRTEPVTTYKVVESPADFN